MKDSEWCVNVDWLAPVAGDRYRAACKFCSCILRAHYSDLRHHLKSMKHTRHAKWANLGGGEPPMFFGNTKSKFVTVKHL